jgi:cell division septation protein DedD
VRNFFLFLLLVNLLALAYQSWIIKPADSIAPDYFVQDVPQLLQVEREARPPAVVTQSQEATAAAAAVVVPSPSIATVIPPAADQESPTVPAVYQCLRIGPFARESDAELVRQKLQSRVAEVRRTAESGRVWLGYWVQTTGYPSRQTAEAARKKLINREMPDAYIIAEGNEYRVSLGVFRLRASAEEVVARVRRQGFTTRTVERYQPGTNFWLLARVAGDRDMLTGALPNVPGQILRTENVPCPVGGI